MEPIGKSARFSRQRPAKSRYLHSPNHLLADELSQRLRDPKHFGFYLKLAGTHDHAVLRSLVGQVLESQDVRNPGKLFAFLVKKYNQEHDLTDSETTR